MPTTIPSYAQKYFWGDDLSQLNWHDHQSYITQTLLEKGDVDTISWLLQQIPKNELAAKLTDLKLSDKSRNFWKIYLT